MKIIRLRMAKPSGTCEIVRYEVPVRIGRHPSNDCRIDEPAISRFHVELDWTGDRLVLRPLGARNFVHVRVAGEMQRLHGCELTTTARQIEFLVEGTWVHASVEERWAHEVAETAQEMTHALLAACAQPPAAGDYDGALRVLDALGRGAIVLRGALQAAKAPERPDAGDPEYDIPAALIRWTQASIAAVSFLEEVLQAGVDHD